MQDAIVVVPYDPQWKVEFHSYGQAIRHALGDLALRIDHIGSTSIEGLDAKPVIDIQISVASLEPVTAYRDRLAAIGYCHREDNPDLTKRYFREKEGMRRTHIHVRQEGSWSQQFALLFRDYLRVHSEDCSLYAATKYKLMALYEQERDRYVEAKGPVIWDIMTRASEWSQRIGWSPGASDE